MSVTTGHKNRTIPGFCSTMSKESGAAGRSNDARIDVTIDFAPVHWSELPSDITVEQGEAGQDADRREPGATA